MLGVFGMVIFAVLSNQALSCSKVFKQLDGCVKIFPLWWDALLIVLTAENRSFFNRVCRPRHWRFLGLELGFPFSRLLSAHWELALKIWHICFGGGGASKDQNFSMRQLNGGPDTQTLGSCLSPVGSAAVTFSKSHFELLYRCWLQAENL